MGRKPKEPIVGVVNDRYDDSKEFLLAVMNDSMIDLSARIMAAKSLLPYQHKQEKVQNYRGKKEIEQEQAVYVQSKFSTFQAPPGAKK